MPLIFLGSGEHKMAPLVSISTHVYDFSALDGPFKDAVDKSDLETLKTKYSKFFISVFDKLAWSYVARYTPELVAPLFDYFSANFLKMNPTKFFAHESRFFLEHLVDKIPVHDTLQLLYNSDMGVNMFEITRHAISLAGTSDRRVISEIIIKIARQLDTKKIYALIKAVDKIDPENAKDVVRDLLNAHSPVTVLGKRLLEFLWKYEHQIKQVYHDAILRADRNKELSKFEELVGGAEMNDLAYFGSIGSNYPVSEEALKHIEKRREEIDGQLKRGLFMSRIQCYALRTYAWNFTAALIYARIYVINHKKAFLESCVLLRQNKVGSEFGSKFLYNLLLCMSDADLVELLKAHHVKLA